MANNKLNIYACSGIGDVKSYNYWTDNTNSISNTQAVNTLLVKINTAAVRATKLKGISDDERLVYLNQLDLFVICLSAAQEFADNPEMLRRAGAVIGDMLKTGEFQYMSLDNNSRDEHLDMLFERYSSMLSKTDESITDNPKFTEWWQKNVLDRNKVYLSEEQQHQVMQAAVDGIGAAKDGWQNADIGKYLNNSAKYFLYTFLTDAQIKQLPGVFKTKRSYQKRIYNYCVASFAGIWGSQKDMDEIISTGIESVFGKTPQEVCEDIVSTPRKYNEYGVGALTEAAVSLINAGINAIVTIVCSILSYAASVNSATSHVTNQIPTNQDVYNGASSKSDYKDMDIPGGGLMSYIPYIGAAALLYYILKD